MLSPPASDNTAPRRTVPRSPWRSSRRRYSQVPATQATDPVAGIAP